MYLSGSCAQQQAEEYRRLILHCLAFWGVSEQKIPEANITAFYLRFDTVKYVPRQMDFTVSVDCLDVSRQAILSPYDWLWTEALPSLLPLDLVATLRKEYQTRDRERQRSVRQAQRQAPPQLKLVDKDGNPL